MNNENRIEREKNIRIANESMRKAKIRYKLLYEIGRFFRVVFCSPLAIMFKTLSVVFSILGKLSSIAIPIGLFYGYLAYKKINVGVSFLEVKEVYYAGAMICIPFLMYTFHFIAEKLNEFFYINSLR